MSDFEVIEEDLDHPKFQIKYRSSSTGSLETVPEKIPTIKILGTGGTIASKGTSSHQTAGYKVDLTIEDLVKTIPDLSTTCNLLYEQILNIDSKEIGEEELKVIYNQVKKDIEIYDGIVITHGTDTMEETAFFLQFTLNVSKPIVLCGSMRPSTAISSDGPMNLYQAIVIASDKNSWNRGILVAFNDRIISGYFLKKSNANSLDTFNAIGQGYLGNFVNNQICYYFPPSKPMGVSHLVIDSDFKLPEVGIVFAHQGLNNDIFKLFIENLKVKGLVIATMGAGSLKESTNRTIMELSNKHGVPIIYSKRSMDGMVPIGSLPKFADLKCNNIIASGSISPQKSRILLQICLMVGLDVEQTKKYFKKVYGGS
ncbi:L-asparaginase 1 [[Candida] jaroonii]|uniref:L-asparaginase 1 n=1 Tax=[Candida] jaroonii TaxID=467808 RepID=A0ACA9Y0H3_9ASCO|nr:L-asparaginase 1 [[Candida] jaroonii]